MAGRRTGGLGKGLDALIPNKAGGPSKEPAKKTRSAVVKKDKPTEKDSPAAERLVKISSVEPNLNQPRRHYYYYQANKSICKHIRCSTLNNCFAIYQKDYKLLFPDKKQFFNHCLSFLAIEAKNRGELLIRVIQTKASAVATQLYTE